jgi:hypothetical protein
MDPQCSDRVAGLDDGVKEDRCNGTGKTAVRSTIPTPCHLGLSSPPRIIRTWSTVDIRMSFSSEWEDGPNSL